MTSISARDFTREFSRVRHDVERGESFDVTHHGHVVMRVSPPAAPHTLGDMIDRLAALPHDAALADDLETARSLTDDQVTDPWADR